jgi:multisubunit Na+/H+ antiporter MnhF subunit
MAEILTLTLQAALAVHVALIAVCVWRVWRGENIVDRLIGTDLISTLMLAVLVLIALIARQSIYMDMALGLAALSVIGTMALAKYIADQRMF